LKELKPLHWLILLVSALLAAACVNQECEEVRPEPKLNIAFRKYTEATRNPRQAKDTSIILSGVYAESLQDSVTRPGATAVGRVSVRLSPLADSTTFVLAGTGTTPVKRTITVRYNKQPAFISQACGYEWSYTNLSVSDFSANLDTAVVIVPAINPLRNEIHIQLYLKP
jgi:hypothetical protein